MESTVVTEDPVPQRLQTNEDLRELGKVFISYAREDQEFALRLAGDLDAHGVTVWIDTGIQSGEEWSQKLEEELEKSNTLVLVVSPDSKKSRFVRKELIFAIENEKHIIPVIHRTCSWLLIADLQRIDFTGDYDESFAKLRSLPVPPLTLRRRFLILLNKARGFWPLLALFAVVAGLMTYRYFFSPSDTHFSLAGADESAIVLLVENRGGRPSTLLSNTFKMDFGALPIEVEDLALDPGPARLSRIPGHGDVEIHLKFARILTPKKRDARAYYSRDYVECRIPGSVITITGQVMESDERNDPLTKLVPGEWIRKFILEAFPAVPKPIYE